MNKEKVIQIFEEVLSAYKGAEEMVIDERGVGADYDKLEKDIEQYRNEFMEALDD